MTRILVTGSRGTVGTPLVRRLRQAGHEVWEMDSKHGSGDMYLRADVGSYRQLERVFEQEFDYVYHLAAEFGRMNGEEYYDTLWQTNVIGTRNVLEWQVKKGFKLIFMSSSEIYGDTQVPWLYEDLPMERPIIQHNDYALSKWVNEVQVMNFEKRHEIPVMRIRLFNAYGPGEYYHPYRSVVCLFCYHALHGQPYTVYEGYHRVFMYIDDLIPTLSILPERFKPGQVYNIGGDEYRSVKDLSDLVTQHTGCDPSIVRYSPVDAHNTVNKRPDITRAMRDLGHNPRTTLEQGVPQTIQWMREVYSK